MKVLVLSGGDFSPVSKIIQESGDEVMDRCDPIDVDFIVTNNIEFIVSHGYRHIIKPPVLAAMPSHVINLHISLLPWNKGADPNLWSFLEDTPKGVTIHYMDAGVDTGDIIAQKELRFQEEGQTLQTTYRVLQEEMIRLFADFWPNIKAGNCIRKSQSSEGSFHKSKDKQLFATLLTNQWDTPVSSLRGKAKQ